MAQRKLPSRFDLKDLIMIISIIDSIGAGLKSFREYNSFLCTDTFIEVKKCIEFIFLVKDKLVCIYHEMLKSNTSICFPSELLSQINTIFKIEQQYRLLVVRIWQKELTKIENYNEKEQCKLLIHSIRNDDNIDEKIKMLDRTDIGFISTSLFYGDETNRAFSRDSDYGLIYDINILNFLGACESDAGLHQGTSSSKWITNQSYNTLKNEVPGCCINSDKTGIAIDYYQMTLTKTPYILQNPNNKNMGTDYNEVGILKKYSKPKAVIQFYYGKPFINLTIDKSLCLSRKYTIPVIYRKRAIEIKTLSEFSNSIEKYYITEALNIILGENMRNPTINLYRNENKVFEYYEKIMECDSKEEAKKVLIKILNNK